jgi:hypothetical protein
MTEKNDSVESSNAGQLERALEVIIKGAQTAQTRPTQNVVQSPFADHIPGLHAQPGQVQPDSQAPTSSAQSTASSSGDVPSSDSSE